jgi:hypothetical protein
MRAFFSLALLLVLFALAGFGCDSNATTNVGDHCGTAGDCVTDLCLIGCSDPCRQAGLDGGCGQKYCAVPTDPQSNPANPFPCYGGN